MAMLLFVSRSRLSFRIGALGLSMTVMTIFGRFGCRVITALIEKVIRLVLIRYGYSFMLTTFYV